MDLRELLREMLEKEASDLHLRVGMPPIFRIDGRLSAKDAPSIGLDDIKDMINQGLSQEQREAFNKKRELDLALSVSKLGRFRVNLYYQRGTPGMAIRSVKLTIPSSEELNLPQVVKRLAEELRGLILVTGTTGSGKSTTLATMVEHINQTRRANILTIEDPIEYVHLNKKSKSKNMSGYDLTYWLTGADVRTDIRGHYGTLLRRHNKKHFDAEYKKWLRGG